MSRWHANRGIRGDEARGVGRVSQSEGRKTRADSKSPGRNGERRLRYFRAIPPCPSGNSPPSLDAVKLWGRGGASVTVDEELNLLDSSLRRLKIEYEVFFSNPSKRPPADIEWKVLNLLRKFSDGGKMNFAQRYRYNEMAQRYAIYSDLWRKKSRIREEGYRRPQDALLSVQGVREEEHVPAHHVYGVHHAATAEDGPFTVQCSDATAERDKVETLYKALSEAKKKAGETVSGSFDSFSSFVQKKTTEIRKQYGCHSVEYTVEVQGGHVKLKAKAKT
jgi:hypothetical protein